MTARARGVRRDHRRQPARGRLRQAARAHRGGRTRSCGVRVVSRPAAVRHVRPLGLRHRPRAHGRVDLRAAAPARGDRVPAHDAPAPALMQTRGRVQPHLLGELDLVPERVERRDPRVSIAMPRSRASASTASKRRANLSLARSSASAGCTPARRQRLMTAKSRSPSSSSRCACARAAPAAPTVPCRASSPRTSASSSSTLRAGPSVSSQSKPTPAARSCSR